MRLSLLELWCLESVCETMLNKFKKEKRIILKILKNHSSVKSKLLISANLSSYSVATLSWASDSIFQ